MRKLSLPFVVNGMLLFFLLWLLSQWTWVFFPFASTVPAVLAVTPRLSPSLGGGLSIFAEEGVARIHQAHFFGGSGMDASESGMTALNLKLIGVFSGSTSEGMLAIINTGESKNKIVRQGEQVLPGVILESVFADHILLRGRAGIERLNLNKKGLI